MLAKVIKNEVFDLNDTVDLMAQVIKRQEKLLLAQDRRMARLEKHFNIDADEDEDQQADKEGSTQQLYTKSLGVAQINSRHSA